MLDADLRAVIDRMPLARASAPLVVTIVVVPVEVALPMATSSE